MDIGKEERRIVHTPLEEPQQAPVEVPETPVEAPAEPVTVPG
jgi:hypothetical protein